MILYTHILFFKALTVPYDQQKQPRIKKAKKLQGRHQHQQARKTPSNSPS
jgi:hypothetical protein